MVHINIPKVRGKMGERGLTITALANQLGIDRNTLSHYLNEPGKTPYNVVSGMAAILCETSEEAAAIFFDPDLRITKVKPQEQGERG